jgi:CheY-like chemotaxis protein
MRTEPLDLVVADDNPVLVSVLSEILRECGHRVRSASNGFSALAEIRTGIPDILVSDLCMPGMSGYELLSVVRRRFPSIRVIAMSGAYSGGNVPRGIAADAFYAKGASSVAQLIQMVSAVWDLEEQSPRTAAPIWISEVTSDGDGASVLFVSCPECLRPFSHKQHDLDQLPGAGSCPHCMTMVELALVRHSLGTDGTPIAIPSAERTICQATNRVKRIDGTPTGRMHQQ